MFAREYEQKQKNFIKIITFWFFGVLRKYSRQISAFARNFLKACHSHENHREWSCSAAFVCGSNIFQALRHTHTQSQRGLYIFFLLWTDKNSYKFNKACKQSEQRCFSLVFRSMRIKNTQNCHGDSQIRHGTLSGLKQKLWAINKMDQIFIETEFD